MNIARRRSISAAIQGRRWQDVAVPDSSFDFLPFKIEQKGRNFRPDPTFDLQSYANITVNKTYYVDKSIGSDSNSGDSFEVGHPLKTLNAAMAKADVDRIFVRNSKFSKLEAGNLPDRDIEIIATDNNVYLTNDWCDNNHSAWSMVDNHYEATLGNYAYINNVKDWSNLDANGFPQTYVAKASIAEVDATPGSYYYVYGGTSNAYVRCFDDRVPDNDLYFSYGYAFNPAKDNRTYYLKGINFRASISPKSNSSAGGFKMYFEDCNFINAGLLVNGMTAIMKNCIVFSSGDSFSLKEENTLVSNAVLIDCDMQNLSNGATDQASTTHGGSIIVILNGEYHDVGGQCIADVQSTARSWLLGVEAYNSRTTGVGFLTEGKMWLDSCKTSGGIVNYDLQASTAESEIYIRNFIGSKGANQIIGTLSTY